MTIGKKLYWSFGAVLAMVVVLFAVNLAAVYREHDAKASASQALELAEATDKVRFQMMQNRLYLSNYLLSGDTREVDRMNEGIRTLVERMQSADALATSEQQRTALAKVQQTEQNWGRDFAEPLMQKRKEVDQGNSTVAELQIFYLQKDAGIMGEDCHRISRPGRPGKQDECSKNGARVDETAEQLDHRNRAVQHHGGAGPGRGDCLPHRQIHHRTADRPDDGHPADWQRRRSGSRN